MLYATLIFIILIITGFVLIKSKQNIEKLNKENAFLKDILEEKKCESLNTTLASNLLKQKETNDRNWKILEYLSKHETITNDQVEAMFKISNSTAYRTLEALEREGKIVQIGQSGRNVFYILNKFNKI